MSKVRDRHSEWEQRIAAATLKQRPGDVMVLAEEAPTQALRLKAHRTAAKMLRALDQPALGLDQIEAALALKPGDPASQVEKGTLLARLGRFKEAGEWLEAAARDHPEDSSIREVMGDIENHRAPARLPSTAHPDKVFLFSGHMIDAPGRVAQRFIERMTKLAAAAIAENLDALAAGEHDLALCEGACGGDLLFAEAALKRNMRLELRLPFHEAEFLERSVAYAGQHWVQRYDHVKCNTAQTEVLVMPVELGATPAGTDPYERANLWQLYTALSRGPDRLRFIALWDGETSGMRGGTEHMIAQVRRHSGRVRVIDTRRMLRDDAT